MADPEGVQWVPWNPFYEPLRKYYAQTYYVHYAHTRVTHLSFTVAITHAVTQLLPSTSTPPFHTQTYYVHYAHTRATHLSFTVAVTQLLPSTSTPPFHTQLPPSTLNSSLPPQLLPSTLNSSLPHSTPPFHTQLLCSALSSSLLHSTPLLGSTPSYSVTSSAACRYQIYILRNTSSNPRGEESAVEPIPV